MNNCMKSMPSKESITWCTQVWMMSTRRSSVRERLAAASDLPAAADPLYSAACPQQWPRLAQLQARLPQSPHTSPAASGSTSAPPPLGRAAQAAQRLAEFAAKPAAEGASDDDVAVAVNHFPGQFVKRLALGGLTAADEDRRLVGILIRLLLCGSSELRVRVRVNVSGRVQSEAQGRRVSHIQSLMPADRPPREIISISRLLVVYKSLTSSAAVGCCIKIWALTSTGSTLGGTRNTAIWL